MALDKKRGAKGPTIASLKRSLQSNVNLYCRLRDAGDQGGAACISCGVFTNFEDSDGGHFVPATASSTRFDPRNVNLQCRRCNRFMHANLLGYFVAMERKYGRDVVDELLAAKHIPKKWGRVELEFLIDAFRSMVKELKEK